jgi:hypothetical protein
MDIIFTEAIKLYYWRTILSDMQYIENYVGELPLRFLSLKNIISKGLEPTINNYYIIFYILNDLLKYIKQQAFYYKNVLNCMENKMVGNKKFYTNWKKQKIQLWPHYHTMRNQIFNSLVYDYKAHKLYNEVIEETENNVEGISFSTKFNISV